MCKHFVTLLVIMTSLSALLLDVTTLACECPPNTLNSLDGDFKRVSYIFIGTVTNITTTWRIGGTGASRDVVFHVNDLIKGPSISSDNSIVIYTAKERSACGIKMKLNERWQIWAEYSNFFSQDDDPRWLTVDSCGRSTKHVKRNDRLLRRWSTTSRLPKSFLVQAY